ncbi:MAG: leucine-rich repeat domain-containing protein [Bacteroidota bacterium]
MEKKLIKKIGKWARKNNIFFPENPDDIIKLKKLDFRLKEVKEIPESIAVLENLESMNGASNALTSLPDEMIYLKNLKVLDLSKNEFTAFPKIIFKLQDLEELYLGGNHIADVPEDIVGLKKLRILDLHNNKIKSLPLRVGEMEALEELNIGANGIESLPESLGKLVNLKKLCIWSNKLFGLPHELGRLIKLEELNLWGNNLSDIPEEIKRLPRLKDVELKLSQARMNEVLIQAVMADNVAMAKNLIETGANVNYKQSPCQDYEFTTPLFEAKSIAMIDMLLAAHADVNLKREKTGKLSIKVWETDDKHTGKYETFLTKQHPSEIARYVKTLKF